MNKQQILEEVKNEIKNNKRVPILNDIEEGASTSWRERPWAANHEANNGMGIELTQIARHVYCSAVIFGLRPCALSTADETAIQQVVDTLFVNPQVVYDLPTVTTSYHRSLLDLTCKLDVEGLNIQELLLEFGLKDVPQTAVAVRVINALDRTELETLDLLLVLKSGRSLFDLAKLDRLISILADKEETGVIKSHPYKLPEKDPAKVSVRSSCERYPGIPTLIRSGNEGYDFATSLMSVSSVSRTRCKLRVCYVALGNVTLDALAAAVEKGVVSTKVSNLASGALRWESNMVLRSEGALVATYDITSRNLFKQRDGLSITTTGPYAIRDVSDISLHAGITVLANSLGDCIRAVEEEEITDARKLMLDTKRYCIPSMVIPVEVTVEDDGNLSRGKAELNVRSDDNITELSLPSIPNGLEIGNTKVTIQGEFLGRTRTYEINI